MKAREASGESGLSDLGALEVSGEWIHAPLRITVVVRHASEETTNVVIAAQGRAVNSGPVSTSIGKRLLALRVARGMTQAEAAAAAEVSQQALSAIERDVRTPGLDMLRSLASGFGIPVGQLVSDLVGDDVTIPAGLARLIDSKLGGDVTADEIRRLAGAQVILGAELEPADFLSLLARVRNSPR